MVHPVSRVAASIHTISILVAIFEATVATTARDINAVQGVEAMRDYHFIEPLILWEALQATGNGIGSVGTRSFADGTTRRAIAFLLKS